MIYLGDFAEDAVVDFKWSTNDAAGASITRATDGTISVYIDNGTTQLTTGVTDTEDFDSLTGIHHCRIDLSASASYAAGSECQVVLSAATIDGQTVNAVLAHFSIERHGSIASLIASVANLATLLESDSDSPGDYRLTEVALSNAANAILDAPTSDHQAAATIGKAIADADQRGARVVCRGTVGNATTPTTTQFTPSALSPAGSSADQFKGRVIVFDVDTASASLRGEAAAITASSAAALPLLTFDTLSAAPASGDTFTIV